MIEDNDTTMESSGIRLSYLCLEQSREGSAAFAHIRGFFDEWPAGSLVVTRAAHDSANGMATKLASIVRAYARYFFSLRRANTAGARAHPAVLPAILVAKIMGKTTFLFLQGRPTDFPSDSLVYRALGFVSNASFKGAMRLSDVIFATSGGLAEWAAYHSAADVIQVTNGVDIARFSWPVAKKSGAVFVGTPAPWQGLDHLIKAANSPEWPTGLPLTVIGVSANDYSGPVSGPVQFMGRLSPIEVANILTVSAIGISPKMLDQATIMGVSPFKLAEYHGAGLAIIASDVPGQSEMLQASGCGILFDPEDPEALAAAVRQLYESPNLLQIMQADARAYAERALTWRAQRSRIVDAITASR